jgi:hypothetical protein
MDRKSFVPVAHGFYRVGRFFGRKLIYQTFIRPFTYLRRKPRYEELHPEDEVTLPRNNMAEERAWPAAKPTVAEAVVATARWTVPKVNRHALRYRMGRDANPVALGVGTVEAAGSA